MPITKLLPDRRGPVTYYAHCNNCNIKLPFGYPDLPHLLNALFGRQWAVSTPRKQRVIYTDYTVYCDTCAVKETH